jgi:type I restriction enzyme S subunit
MVGIAGWKTLPIKELYDGLYDGPHATPKPSDSGPVFLGIKNVTDDGCLDLSEIRHIAEEDYGTWTRRVEPRANDLVFTYEATLNRYALIPPGFRGCLGRRMALIRTNPLKVDARFLLYYFFTDEWRAVIRRNMLTGATVDRIPLTLFPDFPIHIPPLPVQQRIASILSAYDELIENSQRRIKVLESMARALYREWFVHFRFPGHESVRRIASPFGEIPEEWKVIKLFDLARVAYGKNLPTKNLIEDGAYPVYGAAKIIGRYNQFTREHRTIICGCRGSVGEMQITRSPCFVTNNSFTFDSTHPDNFFWLFLTLATRGLRDVIGGAAQPQITLEGISSVELPTPPLLLRSHFQRVVSPMFQQAWALDAQVENLRRTRDLLLPRLLSGQTGVEIV